MSQIKLILQRLKKPSVVLSIISQIVSILLLFNVDVDENIVTGVATAVLSILVLLGIMSNPDTKSSGFGNDLYYCATCGKKTDHTEINGHMVCRDCGSVYETLNQGKRLEMIFRPAEKAFFRAL